MSLLHTVEYYMHIIETRLEYKNIRFQKFNHTTFYLDSSLALAGPIRAFQKISPGRNRPNKLWHGQKKAIFLWWILVKMGEKIMAEPTWKNVINIYKSHIIQRPMTVAKWMYLQFSIE